MNLTRLEAFVAVVQLGSFTRAAERLRTQKARTSRLVGELEDELGVRLLERSTRSLRLTEVGREIYERAQGILEAVADTEQVAQQLKAAPQGRLRLTVPQEFGLLMAFGWVRDFLLAYPQVSVEVDSSSRVLDLVHEGFDLAIRVGPLADSRLAARRLGELRYCLYAAPAYLRRHGVPKDPSSLSDHALLAFAPGGRPAPLRLRRGQEEGTVASLPRLQADSRFGLRDAALAGLGIAELPDAIAAPELAARRLRRVLPDWTSPPVPVHAVFPSNRYLAPKVRAFVEFAHAAFTRP